MTEAAYQSSQVDEQVAAAAEPAAAKQAPLPAGQGVTDDEVVPWARPSIRRPEVQPRGSRLGKKTQQLITPVEIIVLALSMSIVLACAFVAAAVLFRTQVGPGMFAPTQVARAVEPAATIVPPTLVPTYTPTPLPTVQTAAAITATPAPPTPTPVPTLPLPTVPARVAAQSPPTRLEIQKISLDIPVVPVGVKTIKQGGQSAVVWGDVPNAGAFHDTSAYPGNLGNTVINGHRDILGSVFRHLDRVEVGDEITLYVGDMAYPYIVVETLVVPEAFASSKQRAENLRLIGYVPEERLTLITCTPVGLATHRLLVIARPPAPYVPQMPEAGSDASP
jgi:sortase A